ncbi:MAG: hypothetical protein GYB42_04520 [Alphaproteobacteria bacterium]|nr:hypothetical protein [Alphaproteobacteria bacterium]
MDVNAIFGWLRANLDVLVAVSSAVVAVLGAVLARVETRRQRRIQTENLRQSLDTQSLAWGNACIDTLGRAAFFARTRRFQENDGAFLQQRINLMLALSALVERGRLFFPNIQSGGKGAEKEGAYRGHRPPVLDALMFAYYEIEALTRTEGPTADNSADFIDDCRRLLVSELQAHLDPRRRDAVIGRYDTQRLDHREDARVRSETLKALLKSRRPGLNLEDRKETLQ